MSTYTRVILLACLAFACSGSYAQTFVKGKIIDAVTQEPVSGATIQCTHAGCRCGCSTDRQGEFTMQCLNCSSLAITFIGYQQQRISVSSQPVIVNLQPVTTALQEVLLTANRGEGARRTDIPAAITSISSKVLQDTKATMADQVLNKVSGVNMVNLGNEQHRMSIRQPMTTKSLFLYLEDGIPIRTSGLFNHNALLEMNLAATSSIEVIKGPSSSLYGSEAIGGVINFITASPTSVPVLKLSLQGNDRGYKRSDVLASATQGRWGILLGGYYAEKHNGFLEYSDFHKAIATIRVDYRFSAKTKLVNQFTLLRYYSDMAGGVDSAMFANHTFRNQQTFTWRKVNTLRYHATLTHNWSDNSRTTVTALYRDNDIGQNPAYRVKDDYRKVNGAWTGNKELAHGEINKSSFRTLSFIAQHRQALPWKNAVLIGGLQAEFSPSSYDAAYIRIHKDTLNRKYDRYQATDSVLTHYATDLNNYAGFLNLEMNLLPKLRLVASLRYDLFRYRFDNYLSPSAFSGSPDTVSNFGRFSPKIGFRYNFSKRAGVYANYSEGFVPPQVTELYTGVKVPDLEASTFFNYEVGGWVAIIPGRLTADASIYLLKGTGEIISVKNDDGSFSNQNAGRTSHRGIETGLQANPFNGFSLRVSTAWSTHRFVTYREKGVTYDGNEMANAPHLLLNAEVWYKPAFLKGFRLGAELQKTGPYYVDPQNTAMYRGYTVLNLRTGYSFGAAEIWLNALNATGAYYSYITTKSSFGWSYQVAEPRSFNAGISWDMAALFKKK